jgi:hypothetical protein
MASHQSEAELMPLLNLAFKVMPPDLHQDLENMVLGHSNSPKMEQFDGLIQMLQFKNLASASAVSAFSNLPEGTLFQFKFLVGPLSLGNNGGFGFVLCLRRFFLHSLMPRARFWNIIW